jgi:putative alpha-1,2-mannosidase
MVVIPHLNLSGKPAAPASSATTDFTAFVNMVQGPGVPNNADRQVIMRYPLGTIGSWSRGPGEYVDSVTRAVRIYPLVDQTVGKDTSDWRETITGTPAETDITYNSSSPAKGSTMAMTVTPNVSVYKIHFNGASSFGAVGFTLGSQKLGQMNAVNYSSMAIMAVDSTTMQATLSDGTRTIYFYIKFSAPGIVSASGTTGYMKYNAPANDVTVAVAMSHTSIATAQQYLTKEISELNFATASHKLKDAWNAKLGKIDVQNADQLTKQKLYTAFYAVYVNVINATDGSPYAAAAAAYGSPVVDVGSSIGWEYLVGGYFRCAFDQGRVVYYLLNLIDPALMKDILNTYLAQYEVDKVMLGNWDPYCNCWTDQQWGFFGGMFARSKLMGVTGVDYNKAKTYIADTFGNAKNIMSTSGYLSLGYAPADGSMSNYMSRGLEWSTDIQGLAILANLVGDNATYSQWIARGQNYKHNWNAAGGVFQGKNKNGSWGVANQGFFEGTDARYAFDVVHDPLGLADLYGDANMTAKINALLTPNRDYNDYEPIYQILPYYSNSPSTAQDITRNRWDKQFDSLNMWEGWWGGSEVFYTDNAGVLVLTLLGLYPIQAPAAQYVITSPAVTTAVIHGIKDITIQANNNSPSNVYISSLQVNGTVFPSHMISGETLVANNTTITLGMAGTPSRIGTMYITGADGEVLAADTDNNTYLRFQSDPVAASSRAKIYTTKQPTAVTVNGQALANTNWIYDVANSVVNIKGLTAGKVLICFGATSCHAPRAVLQKRWEAQWA